MHKWIQGIRKLQNLVDNSLRLAFSQLTFSWVNLGMRLRLGLGWYDVRRWRNFIS